MSEVSKAIGASVPTVCRWESGENTPRAKPITFRWAELLQQLEAEQARLARREAGEKGRRPRKAVV